MYVNAAFGLQVANARLDELRHEAAARRLRRLVRRSAPSASSPHRKNDPSVALRPFASALTELGGLVEEVRQADRSPDFEFAVVALIADLLDIAVVAGFDDVPAQPAHGDPFVVALRAAGRLAALTAAADVTTDVATGARLERHLDRVRRVAARGSFSIVPTTAKAPATGSERFELQPVRVA